MSIVAKLAYCLLTLTTANATLENGQHATGELRGLNAEQVELLVDGEARVLPRNELRELRFEANRSAPAEARAVLQLVDGCIIPCDIVSVSTEGLLSVTAAGRSWESAENPLRAIRWAPMRDRDQEQWAELLREADSSDVLVIRRETNLDYLKGVILSISADTISFQYEGNTVPVPITRAAGVIYTRPSKALPAARLQVSGHHQEQWLLESARLEADHLEAVTVGGTSLTIPLAAIERIEFPQLDAVWLSSLEPTSKQVESFYGSTEIDQALADLFGPQADHAFDGGPLQIEDPSSPSGLRTFRTGLAIHSRTELTYRLAGKYREFRAMVGIDPSAPTAANMRLAIFTDDRLVFEHLFSKLPEDDTDSLDPPSPVEVAIDLSGANRLKILLDFGKHLDVGDRLHLGDARLLK